MNKNSSATRLQNGAGSAAKNRLPIKKPDASGHGKRFSFDATRSSSPTMQQTDRLDEAQVESLREHQHLFDRAREIDSAMRAAGADLAAAFYSELAP